MLKKINRLSKRSEFDEVKKTGKLKQYPLFGWLFLKKGDKEKKFGFIISKKISKKAVDRNRIKRLMAEILRKNLDKFEEGTRGIFLVKKSMLGVEMKELEVEVKKIIL